MANTAENLPGHRHPNDLVSAVFSDRHIEVGAQPHIHHMLSTLGFGSIGGAFSRRRAKID